MNNRILRQYTIIPPHLYVERHADRQLKDILHDMERPGYVLVARQMGKTNLLLHAKSKYESSSEIYTYIDLSHSFDNELACFENIIDTIIDTHEILYGNLISHILEIRSNKEKSAQRKHLEELRLLLKNTENKLVIILDEIDALTKTTYSDNIFAQIRSIYFQRSNYPELTKLTYILSGVMEPSEIIKNPKISPFNIGQKIYLNDFTREEFNLFVRNSKIDTTFKEDIISRIYYWTNGNPRTTWDLCYEVEGGIDNIHSTEDVDSIVTKLYLTNYNKPPIDNIRDLVISDKELRDAISQIHIGKQDGLSDEIRNKLYLAGITTFSENKKVVIKNRIIEKSLSLNWLKQIEKKDRDFVQIGLDYISNQDYENALHAFETFINQNELDKTNKIELDFIYYQMGDAAYRLEKMDKAIEYLSKSEFDEQTNYLYYAHKINLLGLIYLQQNKIDESISCFQKIISNKEKRIDEIYFRCLINYSSLVIKYKKDNVEEAESIFDKIITQELFKDTRMTNFDKNDILTFAYYNKAVLFCKKNKAIKLLNKALLIASPNIKPTIFLEILRITDSYKEKINAIEEILGFLSTKEKVLNTFDIENSLDFNIDRLNDFLFLILSQYKKSYFEKIKPFLAWYDSNSLGEAINKIAFILINNNDSRSRILIEDIYNNLSNKEYNISDILKHKVLRYLSSYEGKDNTKIKYEYVQMFYNQDFKNITEDDFFIFGRLIYSLIKKREFTDAQNYLSFLELRCQKLFNEKKYLFLYLLHYRSTILLEKGQFQEALTIAEEILQYTYLSTDIIGVKDIISLAVVQVGYLKDRIFN